MERTWRKRTFNPDVPWTPDRASETEAQGLAQGELAPHAASLLMKVLYAARLARLDLFRQVSSLARHVTKWSEDGDRTLHHLYNVLRQKLVGWVGDPLDQVQVAMYAGCRLFWLRSPCAPSSNVISFGVDSAVFQFRCWGPGTRRPQPHQE